MYKIYDFSCIFVNKTYLYKQYHFYYGKILNNIMSERNILTIVDFDAYRNMRSDFYTVREAGRLATRVTEIDKTPIELIVDTSKDLAENADPILSITHIFPLYPRMVTEEEGLLLHLPITKRSVFNHSFLALGTRIAQHAKDIFKSK